MAYLEGAVAAASSPAPACLWPSRSVPVSLGPSLAIPRSPSSPSPPRLPLLLSSSAEFLATPTLSASQGIATEHRDKVTFYCGTTDTDVTIRWVFQNQTLVFNERMQLLEDGKSLTILLVQREDSGTYQCEVRGALEVQSSDTAFLEVNCESPSVPRPCRRSGPGCLIQPHNPKSHPNAGLSVFELELELFDFSAQRRLESPM